MPNRKSNRPEKEPLRGDEIELSAEEDAELDAFVEATRELRGEEDLPEAENEGAP